MTYVCALGMCRESSICVYVSVFVEVENYLNLYLNRSRNRHNNRVFVFALKAALRYMRWKIDLQG